LIKATSAMDDTQYKTCCETNSGAAELSGLEICKISIWRHILQHGGTAANISATTEETNMQNTAWKIMHVFLAFPCHMPSYHPPQSTNHASTSDCMQRRNQPSIVRRTSLPHPTYAPTTPRSPCSWYDMVFTPSSRQPQRALR